LPILNPDPIRIITVTLPRLSLFLLGASVLGASVLSLPLPSAAAPAPAIQTVPGMPPVVDTQNVYSEAGINKVSAVTAGALARVYVPNVKSGDVYVIDPATYSVVDHFKVGGNPQHIIPSWDLKTLWVAGSAERKLPGILTPIDPKTGKPGTTINVPDAYNLYFMPDGSSAIVVAEALKRLEFRDPQTMKLQSNLATPQCAGLNHADFSIDGRYAIFTCEFAGGGLAKIDMVAKKVVGYLKLTKQGLPGMPAMNMPGANNAAASMPQDIRIAPDGKLFYVADMQADGVYLVDGDSFQEVGFIPTGRGTHGLYPSRDGKKLYVTNRGTHMGDVKAHGPGMISVIDFATRKVEKTWSIPGGGSPDMGNVSADGKTLWLSGRFDKVVYAIDTTSGAVKEIPVGTEPHGLTVWPQPGRYSLGHTGNMR
jgi:YVTN family beta-propeller protein